MTRLTITLPDDLAKRLDHWIKKQPVKPSRSQTLAVALSEWLEQHENPKIIAVKKRPDK